MSDPLSHLLFCIAEEVLGIWVNFCISGNKIKQVVSGNNLLVPPYLFYADDVIFSLKDNRRNVRELKWILDGYALLYVQFCNPAKSKIFFGNNIGQAFKTFSINFTGFAEGVVSFTYLGVSIFRGAPKVDFFIKLADDIINKLSKWKGDSLSLADKACYVNSIITTSFIHSMNVFLWPSSLLLKVEKAMRNFIWSGSTLIWFYLCKATVNWFKFAPLMRKGVLM